MPDIHGWFKPHHDAISARFDRVDSEQALILKALGRLLIMSETTDQAIGELTALEHTEATALAKLQADVTAALARIQTGGPLTAAQQAEVDALKSAMAADTATVDAIDASTQPPAPPAP